MKNIEENIILQLQTGELVQSIISWIRNVRNKYNIPKDKLILYIDLLTKETSFIDMKLILWEGMITKYNMGNLKKIEYSLYELFETDTFFEATQIKGINFYIPLSKINKADKIKEILDELSRLEKQIEKCDLKLHNNSFIEKALKEAIDCEQKKKKDFTLKMSLLKSMLIQYECGKYQYDLLVKCGSQEKINWHIQYLREQTTNEELYSERWMSEIYNENITSKEIMELHSILCKL